MNEWRMRTIKKIYRQKQREIFMYCRNKSKCERYFRYNKDSLREKNRVNKSKKSQDEEKERRD